MIKIIELFSGIGAQVAAFKRLKMPVEVVGISEIDKFAIKSYEAINGPTRNYGDIAKIEKLDYADLWTYSSPCQDFSTSGKQQGLRNADGSLTRSGLLLHVERLLADAIARDDNPKYLLMENVKGLVSKKFKPDFDSWLKRLEQLGYNNYWQVLNAKDYGVPQNRERVFVVSIRKDVDRKGYKFPSPMPLEKHLKDMLEPYVDEKYYLSTDKVEKFANTLNKNCRQLVKDVSNTIRCGGGGSLDSKHTWDIVIEPQVLTPKRTEYGKQIRKDYEAGLISESRHNMVFMKPRTDGVSNTLTTVQKDNYVVDVERIPLKFLNRNGKKTDGLYSFCIDTAQTGGVKEIYNNSYRIRKLTPRECWRLMTFTDVEFDCAKLSGVSDSQLYKQAGNSIVVNVLSAIFENLFLKEIPKSFNEEQLDLLGD